MHIVNFRLLGALTCILLTPTLFASPTVSALNPESNTLEGSVPINQPQPETAQSHPRRFSSTASSPESDRPTSLALTPRREIANYDRFAGIAWQNYLPFTQDSLSRAVPATRAIFNGALDGIRNIVLGPGTAKSFSFAYGALRLTLQIVSPALEWTGNVIQEIVKYVEDTMDGITGFFTANFIYIAGGAIVLSYYAVFAGAIWLGRQDIDPPQAPFPYG